MSERNELDKTIEELEAEVIAELEEANDELAEAGADAPKKGSLPSEKGSKVEGERQDTGAAVVDGEQSSAPAKAVAAKAKEVSGDAQQKDSEKDEKMNSKRSKEDTAVKGAPAQGKNVHPRKKASDTTADHIAAGDEVDHDGEDLSESPRTKAEHLAVFEKMTATEIKKMYSSHSAVNVSEDDAADEDEEEIRDQEAIEAAKKEAVEKRIKDIDVKEDVEALMSSDDNLSEEFKEKAATIFEAAVKSRVRSEVERIVEEVASEKLTEMDAFKDELSEKVDTYLNYVVEEWTKENELAIERGLKGEIAEDFISGLKQLFEDHYIDVPDEKYDVLEAQSDKISELEEKLNTEISKSMEVKESNNSLVREQVISEVSEDLADTEVEKFKSLTQDVEFSNEESFKEKLNTLKESYFPKSQPSTSDDLDNDADGSAQDVDTTKSMKSYLNAISASKTRAS